MADRRPDIWFAPARDGGGVYTPVSRQGCLVFAATAAWIVICGGIGMIGFLYALNPLWFVAMVGAVIPVLILFVRTIRRHS